MRKFMTFHAQLTKAALMLLQVGVYVKEGFAQMKLFPRHRPRNCPLRHEGIMGHGFGGYYFDGAAQPFLLREVDSYDAYLSSCNKIL